MTPDSSSPNCFESHLTEVEEWDSVAVVSPSRLSRLCSRSGIERDVIEHLSGAGGGVAGSQIAVRLDRRPGRVRDVLERLEDDGIVVLSGSDSDPVAHLAVDAVVAEPLEL